MTDLQLPTMLAYVALALAASLAALFGIACFINIQRRASEWLLAMIFPVMFIGMGISTLLSNRVVVNAEFDIASVTGTVSDLNTWLMRLASAFVLCVCLARLISISQSGERRYGDSRALLFSFLLFEITTVWLNNAFGTVPTFNQQWIYPALVFITVYYSRGKGSGFAVSGMKLGLFLFLAASLAAMVALPQLALQRDYAGVIPKLNVRLWGLGTNPNSIGPLALVFLLLLNYQPYRVRLIQIAAVATGMAVLVLSQSKTAWISAVIAFPIVWYGRLMYAPQYQGGAGRSSTYRLRQFSGPMLIGILGLAGAIAGSLYFVFSTQIAAITGNEEVSTLTGRTAIWEVALETWRQSPLFGYGATMWDEAFRERIGMNFAFNAHNQFMETLSISGLVGMTGLVIYMLVMLRYCIAANRATRGLSLALYSFIIVRCFTETPFNMSTLFSGEYVTHLLIFALIVNKSRVVLPSSVAPVHYPYPQMQYR